MKRSFRYLALLLTLVMLLGSVNVLAADSLALAEAELPASIDANETVRVMVLLDESATASGLSASHDSIGQDMLEAVPDLQVVYDFTALFSGMSVDMPYGDLDALRQVDGVSDAWVATTYEVPELTGSTSDSASATTLLSSTAYTGEGTVIAVLDTGLNLQHEIYQCNDKILGETALNKNSPELKKTSVQGAYVSNKIPFAYDYAEGDTDVTDTHGHGAHVTGIAAGYAVDDDGCVTYSGTAPGAQLAIMKVVRDTASTTTSDVYFAALQDAYLLGVDVVSMSVGTPCGFTYDSDMDSALFGNIYKKLDDAGIMVCCAAGNNASQASANSYHAGTVLSSYMDYGVVASPSTYLGNLSIANATGATISEYLLEVGGSTYAYQDSIGQAGAFAKAFGGTSVSYVMINGTGTKADFAAAKGKIAVISRGTLSFQEKANNAYAAGAIGLVIYNTDDSSVQMHLTDPAIPTIMVTQSTGTALSRASGKTMYIQSEESHRTSGTLDMNITSSWGTTSDLTLSPTLTAVGSEIVSATVTGTNTYRAASGTSMSTPTVAGQLAVLICYLKDVAPSLTKVQRAQRAEALAESNAQILGTADNPISVRRQGAGVVDPDAAISTGIYIEQPLQELGDDPSEKGTYQMTLTLKNALLDGMTSAAESFSDVSTTDWFHDMVGAMVHLGVFYGTGDDCFSPDRALMRCEAVAVLYRMAGSPAVSGKCTFSDVEPGSFYEDAVIWAQQNNITSGTGDNKFSPKMIVSREQMVALIYRFMGSPSAGNAISSYKDQKDVADYAKSAWCWAVENGIVTSCSTTELILMPAMDTSRSQLVTLMYQLINREVTVQYTPSVSIFTDIAYATKGYPTVNTLSSIPLSCDITYSQNGPIKMGLASQELTVTIKLSEYSKNYIRTYFENGAYVEGYVSLESENSTIHNTFLSYFGDWHEAPILEEKDFRDVAKAEDTIRQQNLGTSYTNALVMNTDANMAQLYCSDKTSQFYNHTLAKLGDNPFSQDADYKEAHMTLASGETDADSTYAQELLVRTRSLRNAKEITYTVRDANTNEVYTTKTFDYCRKSTYNNGWGYSSSFYWDPVDADGNPLPDGTQVEVLVYASLNGETPTLQWSFPCTIDAKAPTISTKLDDEDEEKLIITVTDNMFLSAVQVTDEDGKVLEVKYYSADNSGASHKLEVTLPDNGDVTITAVDYATNVRTVTVTQE